MDPDAARAKEKTIINVNRDELARKIGVILVADDDSDYTSMINRNLSPYGFETVAVNSFAKMKEALLTRRYPLVLCDNIEGRPESTNKLKGSEIILEEPYLFDNSKVILVTGWALNQIEREKRTEKSRSRDITERRGARR